MSRLIDADKIDFNEVFVGASDFAIDTREAAQSLIDAQPTIEAVPVVERNKIIDEFAERLEYSLIHNHGHLLTVDADGFKWLTTDAVGTHINEISERMKGGVE